MEAQVPLDVREYLIKGIKGGERFYSSGNKRQVSFDEKTKEFIKTQSIKVSLKINLISENSSKIVVRNICHVFRSGWQLD